MDDGTIVHALLLGTGHDIEVIDAENYRTKIAQILRDEAIEDGKVPMLIGEMARFEQTAAQLRQRLADLHIELSGESEVAAFWQEESASGPVSCRAMMDHVFVDRGLIYDLKTIRSAHPRTCQRHMVEYGYDIQRAAYVSGLTTIKPELAGREDFIFLFCEIEPPYCVTPIRPDGSMRQLGEQRWRRAVETWGRCLTTDKWPAYTDRIIPMDAPPWAIAQEDYIQEVGA